MIAKRQTGQLAQVGWLMGPRIPGFSSNLTYFYEYEPDPNNPSGPHPLGTVPDAHDFEAAHKYCVWMPTGGGVRYQIDNQLVKTTGMTWTPDTCQWASEVHDLETDYVPGSAGGDCEQLMNVQHLNAGQWIDDSGPTCKINTTTHGRGTWYKNPGGSGGCWYYDNRN